VLKDGLNNEVAELVVDERLNRLERDPDEVLLPLASCRCDAVFDDLAALFVARHLTEVLYDRVVDDVALVVNFEEEQALADHVVAADVTAQLEHAAPLQSLIDERWRPLSSLLRFDKLVFEEDLEGARAVDVYGDFEELGLDHLEHLLQLLARSLSKKLLAEEVGHLVRHQLVEGRELRAEQMLKQILNEPALAGLLRADSIRLLVLQLQSFFVDLVFEELEPVLVLCKQMRPRDEERRAFFGTLEIFKLAVGLGQRDF